MFAKLHIPYDGTTPWNYNALLDDIAALMTGETDPEALSLLTLNTVSNGAAGEIVNTVPAGWTLVKNMRNTDDGFPFSNPITQCVTLKAPIGDGSGREKYLSMTVNTAGVIQFAVGNELSNDGLSPQHKLNGRTDWTSTNSSYSPDFNNQQSLDISLSVNPRHFALYPHASTIKMMLIGERQGHPSDSLPNLMPVIGLCGSVAAQLDVPYISGFGAQGSVITTLPAPVVNGSTFASYCSSATAGSIDNDGVYRVQLCPPTFIYQHTNLGNFHPAIPFYGIGKNGAPGDGGKGARVILDGKTYELWDMQPNSSSTAVQPVLMGVA